MNSHSDIVVFGSTPCGISAALAASRYGRSVRLLSAGAHIGGMMASGLSITDLRFPWAFGGIFKEFTDRVRQYYMNRYGPESEEVRQSNDGIWFEPHVAEQTFEQMLAEQPGIRLVRNVRLVEVRRDGSRIAEIVYRQRGEETTVRLTADRWIDGSYEGDLAALAGVEYRVGREGREEHFEPYAGFIFLKNPGLQVLEGSTGEGDRRIQAYNYRLCLTNRADLRVLPERPADYDRSPYLPLVDMARAGQIHTLNDIIRLAPIPGGKFNGNNRPIAVSLDLPEANTDYPEADEAGRERIVAQYKTYMTGLLWFVQNDEQLPPELRQACREWGFPKDEFIDNGHIPYEFYVREARRIVGRKTFTSHDAFLAPGSDRAPIHSDAVAVGDYHVDSHVVQRKREGWPQIEGHVYLRAISKPAHIPYGVMVPKDIEGLLVPGAMSATHLGFSVLRMEPPWSALGQAAGTAAHLSMQRGVEPADIEVAELQQMLLDAGQVITFFYDVPGPDPIWAMLNVPGERTKQDTTIETAPKALEHSGVQFWGAKGFFNSYYARPYDALTRSEAIRWLSVYAGLEGMTGRAESLAAPTFADLGPAHPDRPYVAQLADVVDGWLGTDAFYPGAALSHRDALRWVARLLPASDLSGLTERHEAEPLAYITRGEFCELLYAIHRKKFDNGGTTHG